ncbi:MAG: hypothetical protein STHCBS139747_003388 [Sporothrix thermara]
MHQEQITVAQEQDSSVHATPKAEHPIEYLVRKADQDFSNVLAQETHSLKEAAEEYRRRRGRHPPPRFDRWYKFAKDRNVVMIESFWDQIYHDILPFWAVPPKLIQREASEFDITVKIRGGHASTSSQWFWTQLWLDLLRTIASELPDMDLALNALDEPRIVVPWEAMADHLVKADRTRGFPEAKQVLTDFQSSPWDSNDDEKNDNRQDPWQKNGSYWDIVRRGCGPLSAARQDGPGPLQQGQKPTLDDRFATPHMYRGFVANNQDQPPKRASCSYVDPYFTVREAIPLEEQFRSKFLPDIDGNSFSGRYLAFLKSSSLPIKATIWKEWHDSRLVAWQHFVPMDSRYGDWYGLMDFFLGQDGDAVAEKIATAGREWAARVLRREDMQVYVFRLLLEYARVLDEKRELLGWVQDLEGEALVF